MTPRARRRWRHFTTHATMMSKEEYKAKWQNEMRESEGPCKVFSFDSKDLANPACGEALADMFGKRSATAREEEQPPAKKPREEPEPEPLEPEPVLREKFDKDVEERVKAQFQLMKVIAEFFTIAEGCKRLEKLPEKEQNCGMVMCTYGDGPSKLSKILRSKEHKHHEHAADVLEMLRASKKQRGMVTFDNKNNDFASKMRALWRDIPELSEIAETPELFMCTAMQPDVTKLRGLFKKNSGLTQEGACTQISMIYLCKHFGISEERANLALFLNAIQVMHGYRVEGSVPHLARFMVGGDLPSNDVFFKLPEYDVAWERSQRIREHAVNIMAVATAQRIGFTTLRDLTFMRSIERTNEQLGAEPLYDSFDQMIPRMEDLLKNQK